MLGSILPRQLLPVVEVFLQRGINDELLADGMPRQFPGELVLVFGLFLGAGGADDQLVKGLDLAVVVLDCVEDAESAGLRPVGEGLDLVAYIAAEDVRLGDVAVRGGFSSVCCGHDLTLDQPRGVRGRSEGGCDVVAV